MKAWLRFPPPLHVLVLAFVLACGAISVVFKTVVLDQASIQRLIEKESTTTQNQVERLAAKLDDPEAERKVTVESHLETMRTYPHLRWAVVCDAGGKILHSTRPEWLGKMLSEVAPSQGSVLMGMAKSTRDPAPLLDDRNSVTAARAKPDSADVPLQYVALVERDLSRSITRRKDTLQKETLISTAMLLAYGLLLWLLLYVFLKWRLRSLYRKTGFRGRMLPGHPHGGDEFAEIASVLGEAEDVLHDVGDNLHEVVWILSPTLEPIYLSPAFEKIHMHKREDAYGKNAMPEYILEDHRQAVHEAFHAVVKGANSLHLEYRIKRGDGQIRWVETSGCSVRDKEGNLQRIVGITRDITDQKALQEELVNASDQERHSLGHDLHDDACQRLAAMRLKCEALAHQLKNQQSPQSGLAVELSGEIAETSALLRNMARGLAPVEVEGDGLVHALQKLVRMQESIHEVACFFEAKDDVIVDDEVVATHLYRIAQELITNAARHAKPTRIDVKLESLPEGIRLTVMNDGAPMQKPPPGHLGMGLKIIHYRASAIGATLETRPRSDGESGTITQCTVPQDAAVHTYPLLTKAIEPALRQMRRGRPAPQSH
jgi:PAS domain S-box-containing protein